jgi:hypothetical protein
MTKTIVSLKDAPTQDVVRALTAGLENCGIRFPMMIDLRDLSENGIELNQLEMIRMVENIRDSVKYGALRGHINTGYANISYGDEKYFTYERLDTGIASNQLSMKIRDFYSFKFFVSENNWIDLYFYKQDGSYVTMVFVP